MIKISIALILVCFLGVTIVAYNSKSQKPTAQVTYYYDHSVGVTYCPITPGTMVLIQSEITDAANWTTTPPSPSCSPGACLCSITFDQEPGDASDGISDGQYSLQEALNALWAEYVKASQFDLPAHNNSFTPSVSGASAITIGRSFS